MRLESRTLGVDTEAGRANVTVHIFFVALGTVTVAGRFWARRLGRVVFGADDWLMAAGLFWYYTQAAGSLCMAFIGGVGSHVDELSPDNIQNILKILAILQFPYALTMVCIRCSICMLLVRVFYVNQSFLRSVYGLIGLNICWALFVMIAAAAICQPFEYSWNKEIPGFCGNQDASYVAIAAFAIVLDSIMFALPLTMVWKLQLRRWVKISLSVVFALGIVDIAVSILRIVALRQINFTGDLSYSIVDTDIWSVLEPGVAILVGCIPTMRPIIIYLSRSALGIWMKSLVTNRGSRTAATTSLKSNEAPSAEPLELDAHKSISYMSEPP